MVFTLIKRSLAAVGASILLAVGVAPAASAAKPAKPKVVKVIDWEAPKPAPGGATYKLIDWE